MNCKRGSHQIYGNVDCVDIDKGIHLKQIQSKIWSGVNLSLGQDHSSYPCALVYIVACSLLMFDKHVICTIKACIMGFLWAWNRKDNAVAKVSWSTLILPKSKGGLGLIDPGL